MGIACVGCGYQWNIGGEVAGTACCGDDAGEYPQICLDSSPQVNASCSTDNNLAKACCTANNKCVDHLGNCKVNGQCHVFGTGGFKSFCDTMAWQDPDESQAYCTGTGCAFQWDWGGEAQAGSADRCCGDDSLEFAKTCAVGDSGRSCGSDTQACCFKSDSCVDHTGTCREHNTCFLFDHTTHKSYCASGTWKNPDLTSSYCTPCGWQFDIGGEAQAGASDKCCGNDPSEYYCQCAEAGTPLPPGNCGTDTKACCNASTDCVDHTGTCQDTNACYNFGGTNAYCNSGTWRDPDYNSTACTSCVASGRWDLGGEAMESSSDKCCGDESNEFKCTCSAGDSGFACGTGTAADACCNASTDCVDQNGACQNTNQCHYFNSTTSKSLCVSGQWKSPDASEANCDACVGANNWNLGGIANCCGDDANEYNRTCVDSTDNGACGTDTKACCNESNDCVDHLGVCKEHNSCYIFGTSNKTSLCSNGIWQSPDESSTYCSACGFQWAVGGEVAGTTCCGDDPGEYYRTCSDSSADGDCSTTAANKNACCSASTDCVDASGNCQNSGSCYTFGSKKSYCGSGTWQGPDEAKSYCEASGCGFTWMPVALTCCGDDVGEDIEQTSGGCCYNGAYMASGDSAGAVMCYSGKLYECNTYLTDDSNLAEHKSTCNKVGTKFCRSNNTWGTADNSCACTADSDCTSGLCTVENICCTLDAPEVTAATSCGAGTSTTYLYDIWQESQVITANLGDSANQWFEFQAIEYNMACESTNEDDFRIAIGFDSNPGDGYRFEVRTGDDIVFDCSDVSVDCPDTGDTKFTQYYSMCPCGNADGQPHCWDKDRGVYIRVFRKAGASASCSSYSLRILVGKCDATHPCPGTLTCNSGYCQ